MLKKISLGLMILVIAGGIAWGATSSTGLGASPEKINIQGVL